MKVLKSASDWTPKYLYIVAGVFITTVLVSNIAAQKLFAAGPFVFTAGILVFPLSYIIGDVLTEVYGFARARKVIYLGLLANLFMAAVLWLAIQLPPAAGWELQEQFATVLGFVPRIILASILGYVAGELANSLVMSRLKVRTAGKHLWIRTISSTLLGQLIDTVVFAVVAFTGVVPDTVLLAAIISGWLFKVIYEVVATPLTYLAVNQLKKEEGVDYFDTK